MNGPSDHTVSGIENTAKADETEFLDIRQQTANRSQSIFSSLMASCSEAVAQVLK